MKRRVWKFPLEVTHSQTIMAPIGDLEPLHVAFQGEQLCLWASVTGFVKLAPVSVYIVGAGNTYEAEGLVHAGTAQDGSFVWHVFIGGAA